MHEFLARDSTVGALSKGGMGKMSYFLALCVDISKTVRDTTKVAVMTNRKLHMRFRLAARSMTLDDLELL